MKENMNNLLKSETTPIIICCHKKPDGDTIGSMLALFGILKKHNSNVKCGFTQEHYENWPTYLKDLYRDEINTLQPEDFLNEVFDEYENYKALMVDFRDANRAENENVSRCKELFAIDHHPWKKEENNEDFNIINNSKYPATTHLIFDIVEELFGKQVLKDTNFLNTITKGLITDTGGFRFSSVDKSNTYGLIQLFLNANKNFSVSKLRTKADNVSYSEAITKARADLCALENCVTKENFAYLIVDKKMKSDYKLSSLAMIASFLNNIEEFKSVVFCYEEENGAWKFSLRSKAIPINEICQFHGGNGHSLAAGFEIKEEVPRHNIEKLCQNILAHLIDAKKNPLRELKDFSSKTFKR